MIMIFKTACYTQTRIAGSLKNHNHQRQKTKSFNAENLQGITGNK